MLAGSCWKNKGSVPIFSLLSEEKECTHIVNVSNIKEALALKSSVLREAIKQTLKERPNQTAKKEAMAGFVLKELGVITRGQPREAFSRKVKQTLTNMRKNSEIEEYQTEKNKRIKLMN